jgi:HMW1C N-terminal/HMW1 domain 2
MTTAAPTPSLEAFELAVARRDSEAALNEAFRILRTVDDRYGRLDLVGGPGPEAERSLQRIATRFCAAFGPMICDPATPLNAIAFEQLIAHHRWIELMFSASGFAASDYLAPLLSTGEGSARRVPKENLARFLLIYSAAAGMGVNLDEALNADPPTAIGAALGYLATRFCFTDAGHAFREQLLEWLPGKLDRVKLGGLALQSLASPYMHCSYATTPRKHAIKAPMMAQMRRGALEAGCPEYDPAAPPGRGRQPTIVVTTENFSLHHSVWRTHSRAVMALRRSFRTVGFLYPTHRSAEVDAAFDEAVSYVGEGTFLETVGRVAGDILAHKPAMVLHLGVGMSPFVIGLAALRLAPVQAVSFGHTATTASPVIDHMILPQDFVGDPALFTENLVGLPAAAFPYRIRDGFDYAAVRARAAARANGAAANAGPLRIAVPASVMKLAPPVFDALAKAAAAAPAPVEFHIFPLGCSGLGYAELVRRLATRLPTAVVHPELPYDDYIEQLASCAFFVCPFPYGNMNSIVDAALAGLPGVCLDGAEAHAHADAAYFRRMGFPEALIAASEATYVAAIVRLAADTAWRAECRAMAAKVDASHAFFAGDEGLFVQAVEALIAPAAPARKRKSPRR